MTIDQATLAQPEDEELIEAPQEPEPEPVEEASPLVVALASFFATAAAAWTVGGLFAGMMPRIVAIVAAGIGAGVTGYAVGKRRGAIWHAAALPIVATLAVVLSLAAGAHGGLLGAIRDAIHGGGPSGQPLGFSAGWRFLVVLFTGTLGAGACSLALSLNKPRAAVIAPVGPMIASALVQPKGSSLVSGIPAIVLLLLALIAAYGVELSAEGASSGRFEMRRIVRGVVALAVLAGALAGLSHAGFLFPVSDQVRVIPPQLPPYLPPPPDHELFTVRSTSPGPWRMGVLDVYDGRAWRLPPYDPARFAPVAANGTIPNPDSRPATLTATFSITDLSQPVLPSLADASRIDGTRAVYDPRTQVIRTPDQAAKPGSTYTMSSAPPPTGLQLANASPAPASIVREFAAVPSPPPQVTALLAGAPVTPLWDRLQYVRTEFYRKVVATGAGRPASVSPARAAEILGGKPASPYEISAAEALLARWAGLPARIGYGFYQGRPMKNGALSVHPDNAATWLEVYFGNYGWVPVVGVPPRAISSLSKQRNATNPLIQPTDQLALVLYVPIRLPSLQLLYVFVRYWILVALPFIAGALLLLAFYPAGLKLLRRVRRNRWARKRGVGARIAVAYAELRDIATDLNIGEVAMTPFDFALSIANDEELLELSWLVSRGLWGDLQRDLREEDAIAAERMARSVIKRLRRAQPGPTQVLALASRASLREPYLRDLPNQWPARAGGSVKRTIGVVVILSLVTLVAILASTTSASPHVRAQPASLPSRIVPDVLANVTFREEQAVEQRIRDAGSDSLISAASVYTFISDGSVQGYLEVGSFKRDLSASRSQVRRGVLQGIGEAQLKLSRFGLLRIYTGGDEHRGFVLWFAPDGSYFELMVDRRAFGDPAPLFAQLLEYQGNKVGTVTQGQSETPIDPRRGEPS
ncbi:MAG: transglutaminase family protein [Actinomycetota bacterium]